MTDQAAEATQAPPSALLALVKQRAPLDAASILAEEPVSVI